MKTCVCGKKMLETWEEFGDPRQPICINCFLNPPDIANNKDEIEALEEEIADTEDEIQELERELSHKKRELHDLKLGKPETTRQHEKEIAALKAWKAQQ